VTCQESKNMAFPDPVTSDLRPKTEVSVYAFSEANAS